MTVTIIPLPDRELPSLTALLAADSLPTNDLTAPGRCFWRVDDDHGLAGYGGLESHGSDGLLRSVIVPLDRRADGTGRIVVAAVVGEVRRLGIERLWLLTTDAAGFFERLGFQRVERASAPPAIQSSTQFAGLCPSSAICMRHDLVTPVEPAESKHEANAS